MANKYKLGLVTMKMGAIAGDGGMGTTLTALGDTVAGSATLTTEEATSTDFRIEESDSPIMSIKTEADRMTLVWSTYAADAASLVKFFGGTVIPAAGATPAYWEAPDTIPELEQSIEATWKEGGRLEIPRAKVVAKLDMSFKRDTLSKVDLTATVLQPTKVGEPRLTIHNQSA